MTAGKVVAILAVWIAAGVLFVLALNSTYVTGAGIFGWILLLTILGVAGGVSGSITSSDAKSERKPMVDVKVESGKAKRGENIEDLLALLDEDDLYELRQRAKQRLIERIEDGTASDVASFEQLLNEQSRKRR
ncbi:MAG: hypothetical protein H3C32_11150 [Anaerolineae bacterium]|nr:MAG: hypothetical protein UZ13_02289 [Chloroflexi bacterium OLB13]MBW7879856.1 hypothetical protein [Anaerolineae bacterium]